jgi:hypothetical protein
MLTCRILGEGRTIHRPPLISELDYTRHRRYPNQTIRMGAGDRSGGVIRKGGPPALTTVRNASDGRSTVCQFATCLHARLPRVKCRKQTAPGECRCRGAEARPRFTSLLAAGAERLGGSFGPTPRKICPNSVSGRPILSHRGRKLSCSSCLRKSQQTGCRRAVRCWSGTSSPVEPAALPSHPTLVAETAQMIHRHLPRS